MTGMRGGQIFNKPYMTYLWSEIAPVHQTGATLEAHWTERSRRMRVKTPGQSVALPVTAHSSIGPTSVTLAVLHIWLGRGNPGGTCPLPAGDVGWERYLVREPK